MIFSRKQLSENESRAVLTAILPGPARDQEHSLYQYRLMYRNPDAAGQGCLMLWQVIGGRDTYQITLERDEWEQVHWHCTCADAIYRGSTIPGHVCKHVAILAEFVPPVANSAPSRAA